MGWARERAHRAAAVSQRRRLPEQRQDHNNVERRQRAVGIGLPQRRRVVQALF